jgi:hypothetical protein
MTVTHAEAYNISLFELAHHLRAEEADWEIVLTMLKQTAVRLLTT